MDRCMLLNLTVINTYDPELPNILCTDIKSEI